MRPGDIASFRGSYRGSFSAADRLWLVRRAAARPRGAPDRSTMARPLVAHASTSPTVMTHWPVRRVARSSPASIARRIVRSLLPSSSATDLVVCSVRRVPIRASSTGPTVGSDSRPARSNASAPGDASRKPADGLRGSATPAPGRRLDGVTLARARTSAAPGKAVRSRGSAPSSSPLGEQGLRVRPDPAHNPKVAGSNPAPATTKTPSRQGVFVLNADHRRIWPSYRRSTNCRCGRCTHAAVRLVYRA